MQATRDFAVEAAQLSEALAQKEEEVQMTGQHCACVLALNQTVSRSISHSKYLLKGKGPARIDGQTVQRHQDNRTEQA